MTTEIALAFKGSGAPAQRLSWGCAELLIFADCDLAAAPVNEMHICPTNGRDKTQKTAVARNFPEESEALSLLRLRAVDKTTEISTQKVKEKRC